METDQMGSSVSELQAIVKNIDSEISRLQTLIVGEDDKMLRYKVRHSCLQLPQMLVPLTLLGSVLVHSISFNRYQLSSCKMLCASGGDFTSFSFLQVENIRRKHNYLPLIMELLKVLAKQGNLVPLVEKVCKIQF